jgi:hypothetical protein
MAGGWGSKSFPPEEAIVSIRHFYFLSAPKWDGFLTIRRFPYAKRDRIFGA